MQRIKKGVGTVCLLCMGLALHAGWLDSLFSMVPSSLTVTHNSAPCPDQGFGKTHFILGYPDERKSRKPKQKPKPQPAAYGAEQGSVELNVPDIFFSPDDDVRSKLLALIAAEQEAISIAMFVFTDQQIARALIDAADRGVAVEVVTDSACIRDRFNKVGQLCARHVPVYVYDASGSRGQLPSTMHHKFVLFARNYADKPLVWTGSFNFTRAACESNQENALILDESRVISRCDQQFRRLKSRSYRYGS